MQELQTESWTAEGNRKVRFRVLRRSLRIGMSALSVRIILQLLDGILEGGIAEADELAAQPSRE